VRLRATKLAERSFASYVSASARPSSHAISGTDPVGAPRNSPRPAGKSHARSVDNPGRPFDVGRQRGAGQQDQNGRDRTAGHENHFRFPDCSRKSDLEGHGQASRWQKVEMVGVLGTRRRTEDASCKMLSGCVWLPLYLSMTANNTAPTNSASVGATNAPK
jgi:hypothetical protein